MSTGILDHLYHQQVAPPSPIVDSKLIPNPRIVLFYRRATYADVLAASDASWRNVLHQIDWERHKIPVPSEMDRQTSVGDTSSGEETESAEERDSSDDGRHGNINSPVASPPVAQQSQASQIHSRPAPVIVQPAVRVIPNPHHAQTSIFRPSPTPLVFHQSKPTVYGHPVGETQLQLKSPPPAHQTSLQPVVLKPIQNLSHSLQQTIHQNHQHSPQPSSNRHLLMVYTKPVISAKTQVIRLVNRNATVVGTNPGI
ncbi:hypothetical protein CpipJ_CPIJ004973 [Culex quinquefasciatus]|uniref:Uncharacterized protein n=1 Tax=Culex quinquefasciatus TaxID=7176 RepID=B0WD30_CULQU|nr:hypothetical protein CpipJ_CPIJ004973 [Culex quinquefasciatus]|eukprot:XP_001846614.1 hypothetical protein CpipJ_CPIJ004973 [Culex quinquefasciatus]